MSLLRHDGKQKISVLHRYGEQLGRLVEREMSVAALIAARQDAEFQAKQATQAMLDARASADALRGEIDQRVQVQSRLAYLANHDSLTALANRVLLGDSLIREMDRARRTDRQIALLCLDLDHFKDVNDTLGHAAGDSLLREIARRLQSCVRQGSLVARMGGDEFAILVTDLDNPEDARILSERIIAMLAQPIEILDQRIFISASIGITLFPHDGGDAEMLLRNGDLALYRAKREGRNGYYFFDGKLNEEVRRRTSLEQALHEALALNQLWVAYQPQIDVAANRLDGAEALLRWNHPDHGPISPTEFIPAAERSGLINRIGAWVMAESCRQLVRWDAAGMPPIKVAVNVATTQFRSGDVPKVVNEILTQTGLAPHRLELEITESGVMHDIRDAAQILKALHQIGVGLAIDDFGTGYSSLSYLRKLPVDKIKIDRSFVTDISHNEDAATVVRTIVTLGHNLRLKVVAEGVETEAHAHYARMIKCDYGQGYFYGKPMSAADLLARSVRRRPTSQPHRSQLAGIA